MTAARVERNLTGLAWGLLFIGLGVVFLLGQFGWMPSDLFRRVWPLWPAVFGVAAIVGGRTAKRLSEGVFMIGLSGYLFVSNEGLWGLGWGNSWPLVLVAIGLSQVVEVIASRWLPMRESGTKGRGDA